MEIIITVIIVGTAGLIFYRSLKKKAAGKCDCKSCSGNCCSCSMHRKEQ